MISPNDQLAICFAHVAYQLHERSAALDTGIHSFAVRDAETLANRIDEADVLVISGLWQNSLLDHAPLRRLSSMFSLSRSPIHRMTVPGNVVAS